MKASADHLNWLMKDIQEKNVVQNLISYVGNWLDGAMCAGQSNVRLKEKSSAEM